MAITTLNLRALNRSDTASSGQLVTATSATAMDFQDAAGGAWNFISNTTISDDATILVEGLDSTYKLYQFVFMNINNDTDDVIYYLRVKSGGSIISPNYRYVSHGWRDPNNAQNWAANDSTFMRLNNNGNEAGTAETQNHILYMWNPASTSSWTHIYSFGSYTNDDDDHYVTHNSGVWDQTAAVTGLQLSASSGTFTTGNILLYGQKMS